MSKDLDAKQHLAQAEVQAHDSSIFGIYQVESDFGAHGVWVSDELVIPVEIKPKTQIRLKGIFFPKLVEQQTGRSNCTFRFLILGKELYCASLAAHGTFTVTFEIPLWVPDAAHRLTIVCSHHFVPNQIKASGDDRRLAWRLTELVVDTNSLFNCTRRQSVLVYESLRPEQSTSLHFHLDRPRSGSSDPGEDLLFVSGWSVDVATASSPRVRLVVDGAVHDAQQENRPDVVAAFASIKALPRTAGFWGVFRPPSGRSTARVEVQAGAEEWNEVACVLVFRSPPTPDARLRLDKSLRRLLVPPRESEANLLDGSRTLLQGTVHFHLDTPKLANVTWVKEGELFAGWAVNVQTGLPARIRFQIGHQTLGTTPTQRQDVQKTFANLCSLPADTGFSLAPSVPFGFHPMRIEVEAAPGLWHTVTKTLLVRVPGKRQPPAGHTPVLSYRAWRQHEQRRLQLQLPEIRDHISVLVLKPLFTVVIDARASRRGLTQTLTSIQSQVYPPHQTVVLLNGDGHDVGLAGQQIEVGRDLSSATLSGDFISFLLPGERLSSDALYEFANVRNQAPDSDLIYGDHDIPAGFGRVRPFHKPAWSPDYLETFNYIGFPASFRRTLAQPLLDSLSYYDFVLRFTEQMQRVSHIKKILGHGMSGRKSNPDADIAALRQRLSRTGRSGAVSENELHGGCYNIRLRLRDSPLVSVVIPTAGKSVETDSGTLDLVQNIVDQIVSRSTYRNIEIVIIDNGNLSSGQIGTLANAGCKRVTYTDPVFNISKKLNLGARNASGQMLLLLNDDIEILTPSWIELMLEHFEKPHVGVVGAKLLYPFGKIQHAGVVHNNGNPDHVRRLYPSDENGYFYSTCGVRNYSAVTGACMMTSANTYMAVGGYSEELAVSFNDIDFCLKVRDQGLSIVYAPAVELTHMESVSRTGSLDVKELTWYHERWAHELVYDAYYPERFLTVNPPTFETCINARSL